MSKDVVPIHGLDHLPGGPDPVPFSTVVIGPGGVQIPSEYADEVDFGSPGCTEGGPNLDIGAAEDEVVVGLDSLYVGHYRANYLAGFRLQWAGTMTAETGIHRTWIQMANLTTPTLYAATTDSSAVSGLTGGGPYTFPWISVLDTGAGAGLGDEFYIQFWVENASGLFDRDLTEYTGCFQWVPEFLAGTTVITDMPAGEIGPNQDAIPVWDSETGGYVLVEDEIDFKALVGVRKNSAGSTFDRHRVNFIEGANIVLTVADDSGNDEVDVTVQSTASLFSPEGAWAIGTAYVENDIVHNDGSSYFCILAHTGQEPPNATYWQLVASVGDTGAAGSAGPTGPAGATAVDTSLIAQWGSSVLPASGPHGGLWRVPYLLDGDPGTFDLERLSIHLETPGSTSTEVKVQKCAPNVGFGSAVDIGTVTIAAADYDEEETAGLGSIDSGDMLRINFVSAGTGAAEYTVEFEASPA